MNDNPGIDIDAARLRVIDAARTWHGATSMDPDDGSEGLIAAMDHLEEVENEIILRAKEARHAP